VSKSLFLTKYLSLKTFYYQQSYNQLLKETSKSKCLWLIVIYEYLVQIVSINRIETEAL